MKKYAFLMILCLFLLPNLIQAQQGPPQVAYINSSGQLIVAGSDGVTRWIVSNPGETLHPTVGYSWSPDRMRIFYAVNLGASLSLRVAEVAIQSVTEVGQVSGTLSGGEWLDNSNVIVATLNGLVQIDIRSGGTILIEGEQITIPSPFGNDRPHLSSADSTASPFIFFWQNGNYGILGNGVASLPEVANDPNARNSGIWSGDGQLVAYWGFGGDSSSQIAVTHANSLNTISFASGSSTPTSPIAWSNPTTLLFRDASGTIRLADVGCVVVGCDNNPLELSVAVAPASATDFQAANTEWGVYIDNNQIQAVPLRCVVSNDCNAQTVTLGTNAAPRTILHISNNRLIYTAFTADALNPTDRNTMVIDDLGCLPNCQVRVLVNNAIGGMLSLNGNAAVVDIIGEGMHIVNIEEGSRIFLTQVGEPGSGLLTARW